MSTTTRIWPEGSGEPADRHSISTSAGGPVADVSLIGASSDTCSRCGAGMAPDQHYCVECGQRRGKPRFALPATGAKVPAAGQIPNRSPRRGQRMGASASTTLIAGIATLLLALGVGVLIGENNAPAPAAKDTVITVSGGVGAATTTPTTGVATDTTAVPKTSDKPSPTATNTKASKVSKAPRASKASTKPAAVAATKAPSAAAVSAANKAVQKTLGNNAGSATAQPGQSCAAGTPGCENGKQTGNLFGGG